MKNAITKIKKFSQDNRDNIVLGVYTGCVAIAAAAATYYVMKVDQRNDIIVPAKLVEHMKDNAKAIMGIDVIPGYDVIVKLIPVQS